MAAVVLLQSIISNVTLCRSAASLQRRGAPDGRVVTPPDGGHGNQLPHNANPSTLAGCRPRVSLSPPCPCCCCCWCAGAGRCCSAALERGAVATLAARRASRAVSHGRAARGARRGRLWVGMVRYCLPRVVVEGGGGGGTRAPRQQLVRARARTREGLGYRSTRGATTRAPAAPRRRRHTGGIYWERRPARCCCSCRAWTWGGGVYGPRAYPRLPRSVLGSGYRARRICTLLLPWSCVAPWRGGGK